MLPRCIVCQHCEAPEQRQDRALVNGFSYHEECRKCYVCSETNLQNADVFRGVIFCYSCSQRIFQGCSTARRTKENIKKRERVHRRRRSQDSKGRSHNHILEMAGRTASSGSSKSCSDAARESPTSKPLDIPTEIVLTTGKPLFADMSKTSSDIKRNSADIGMTTEVTQELLKEMNCPVVDEKIKLANHAEPTPRPSRKRKIPCSDLRIAELGASTEIANMALRHKSELPVIIKSENHMKSMSLGSHWQRNRDSANSGDRKEKWFDSAYSTLEDSDKAYIFERSMHQRIRRLFKLPYMAFRRHVLTRSSFISVLMSSEDQQSLLQNMKLLFDQEITCHQRRGLKRLYSTINRKQTPNKLGWLNLGTDVYDSNGGNKLVCKHMKASHSYRCMRAQVMKLAGPTKSELAVFRSKMKNLMALGFLRAMHMNSRRAAIMMSEACGTSRPCSTSKGYVTKLSMSNP